MPSAKVRLIIHEFSRLSIPKNGTVQDGINAIVRLGKGDNSVMKQASDNVESYIAVIKTAPDNPFKSDEEICEEILRQVNEKQKQTKLGLK